MQYVNKSNDVVSFLFDVEGKGKRTKVQLCPGEVVDISEKYSLSSIQAECPQLQPFIPEEEKPKPKRARKTN